MKALVNAVWVTALWFGSYFLSQWLLLGTGCLFSASALFSWWFVAYFTKNTEVGALTIIATYAVLVAAIISLHYSGYYSLVFGGVPNYWASNIWVSFIIVAFVMVTPLIFNWCIRVTLKAVSHIV